MDLNPNALTFTAQRIARYQPATYRRNVLEPTGARREPGRAGGRPAELYRFRSRRLEVTDPFAALRPREHPRFG